MGRATTDFVEQNRMRQTLHSPYSSDLAPSDFYLFGYVKGCGTGFIFKDTDLLFGAVRQILKNILEWMERLKRCIITNGNYIE
jgi:hypothetical protein